MLSLILYISLSLSFASVLKMRQSCMTSTNENPLWVIAFENVSTMCGMSRAFVLAMKVALLASASLIGLKGLSWTPSGFAFEV